MKLVKSLAICLGLSAMLIGCNGKQADADKMAENDATTPMTTTNTDMGQTTDNNGMTGSDTTTDTTAPATDSTDSANGTMPSDEAATPSPDNTGSY